MREYKYRVSSYYWFVILFILLCCVSLLCIINFINSIESLISELNLINPNYINVVLEVGSIFLGLVLVIYLPLSLIYYLISIFYNRLSISEQGITIKSLDTNLFIGWGKIIGRREEMYLSIQKRQYIILGEKIKFYNRGLNSIFAFWYKTNQILYSIYEDNAIREINERLKLI